MQLLHIPKLYCPIDSSINSFFEQATNHTIEWVQRFNLHTGESLIKFIGDNFGSMTARFYPTASLERLKLANDINSLLFVMDDAMDHQVEKSDMILSRQNYLTFVSSCMEILVIGNTRKFNIGDIGVLPALEDVWTRLKAISDKTWQLHFIHSIEEMFEAGKWEFDNVQTNSLPAVREFISRRPYLGAAHISTDLISVIEDIRLPNSILTHQSVNQATLLCQRIVCWANDLFSYPKEEIHGDMHNLVSIILRENNCTLQEAILKTVTIHNQDMTKFITVCSELPSFGDYDSHLRHYIRILGAILKGNVDWSTKETHRYEFIYG